MPGVGFPIPPPGISYIREKSLGEGDYGIVAES